MVAALDRAKNWTILARKETNEGAADDVPSQGGTI